MKCTPQDNNTNDTVHSTLGQLFKSFQCLRKSNRRSISNRIAKNSKNNKSRRNIIECSSPDKSCYIISDSTDLESEVLNSTNEST